MSEETDTTDTPESEGLSGKERRALRAEGQRMEVGANIGKQGLSATAVANVEHRLAKNHLVKVQMPKSSPDERKAMAQDLATRVGGELISGIGHKYLIYREVRQGPK